MKKLLAWLKEPKVWAVLGLIALGLVIWVGGPFVRFGEDNVAPLASVTARLIALLVIVSISYPTHKARIYMRLIIFISTIITY